MKRAYEMIVLVRPASPERARGEPDFPKDTKAAETLIKKLIGDGVTIKELTPLGKKQLAYPIKKQTEAVYLLATIEADGLVVGEVEKQARLMPDVLRYLLTVKE